MKIEAAIPPGLLAQRHEQLDPPRQKVDCLKPFAPDTEAARCSLESASPAEEDDHHTEVSRGVLRLLQEGHFKGVADVRLRINFADELEAIEQTQRRQIVNQKIGAVLESVTSTLRSGEPTEIPLDPLIKPFEQAVNESKENLLTAEAQSTSILTSELKSAFENLILSLTEALARPEVEIPEEGSIQVDTTMDEDASVSDLVAGLKAAFSSAMDDLAQELSGAMHVLPELSEPNGNGAAYDKFLNIYNEMQTPGEPADAASNRDRLDTSA